MIFKSTVLAVIAFFGSLAIAQAQASRTWVSGVGDDANPCSRTAPCKTFALLLVGCQPATPDLKRTDTPVAFELRDFREKRRAQQIT